MLNLRYNFLAIAIYHSAFFFLRVFVCLFLTKTSLKSLFVIFFLFIVYCRFKRNMQDPDMIDLTDPLYLVYVSGPTSTSHNNIS